MKPNKKNIIKWVKALRSGNYKQTTNALQDDCGYCCLGVACDLFIKPSLLILKDNTEILGNIPSQQDAAPEWLKEFTDHFYNITKVHITTLNDSGFLVSSNPLTMHPIYTKRFSFDEIADVLEAVYVLKVLDVNNV
jgi:hypothetical protein